MDNRVRRTRTAGLLLVAIVTAVLVFGASSSPTGASTTPANGLPAWALRSIPKGTSDLSTVSCSSSTCLTVEPQHVLYSHNSGTTWTVSPNTPDFGTFTAASCGTREFCVLVGYTAYGEGLIAMSKDGGVTWAHHSSVRPDPGLSAVSCSTSEDCTAVAGYPVANATVVYSTVDGGTTWTSDAIPSGVNNLTAISCPTASACVAIGTHLGSSEGADSEVPLALTTTDGGAEWTIHIVPLVESNDVFNAISCSSASVCVVGGRRYDGSALLFRSTDSGAKWVDQSPPPYSTFVPGKGPYYGALFEGVDCPSASDCVVVGEYGGGGDNPPTGNLTVATTNGGATWSLIKAPSSVAGLTDVSCTLPLQCVAVGANSQATGMIVGSKAPVVPV